MSPELLAPDFNQFHKAKQLSVLLGTYAHGSFFGFKKQLITPFHGLAALLSVIICRYELSPRKHIGYRPVQSKLSRVESALDPKS